MIDQQNADSQSASQPPAGPLASSSGNRGFWATAASVRPGLNSIRTAIALTVMSLIYFAFSWPILLFIVVGSTAAILMAAIGELRGLFRSLKALNVSRSIPSVIGRGEAFSIVWRIRNDAGQTLNGEVRDVFPLGTTPRFLIHPFEIRSDGEITTLNATVQIGTRGCHNFEAIWIRLRGFLGLVEFQQPFFVAASIKVLPEQFASRDQLQKDRGAEVRLLDKATRMRQRGSGTEFESLTEFREGDDPRRIDWRATARTQRPVIRRFQIERHRDVMILLDCGRLMGTQADRGTKLDCAVDSALMLARVVLQSGDRCGMALYDSEVRGYLPPIAGLPSLRPLTDSIYDVQSDFRESDFNRIFAMLQARQAKRSLIVVLSDVVDAETSAAFRASLGLLGRRHIVVFAALRTPLLNAIMHQPVETMIDAGRMAVAFRLMYERQLALQSLKHLGVIVLDVEPSRLTTPLINQVVELRRQNLL